MIKPPVMVADPELTASAVKDVEFAKRVPPATIVAFALPSVRFASAPVWIDRFPSVALAVNTPPVTFERPITVADVNLVIFPDVIEANVPPVALRIPLTIVFPT